jgi:hypothetical protein
MHAMQCSTNVMFSEKDAAFNIITDYSSFYPEYMGRKFFQNARKYLRQQTPSHLSVWY